MGRSVLLSLRPEWFRPIMCGMKTKEVRKRAPLNVHPYKVYLYCTKGGNDAYLTGIIGKRESYRLNGTVCGEFICESTMDYTHPFSEFGTYLTKKELETYAFNIRTGEYDRLSYMSIRDPIMYDKPKSLEDFGIKHAPQSWRYI